MELLEQILDEMDTKPIEVFSAKSVENFSSYYQKNQDKIQKLYSWISGGEGIILNGKSVSIDFHSIPWDISMDFPFGQIQVPYQVLEEMGYKKGDSVDYFTLFLELEKEKINAYLAKKHSRQISRKMEREIWKEINEALGDEKTADGF